MPPVANSSSASAASAGRCAVAPASEFLDDFMHGEKGLVSQLAALTLEFDQHPQSHVEAAR